MADANIRINVETSSLEQLNAELSALQAQIAKVPVGSAEFKKLSAEIRRVDGAVEGANRKLKSLDVGAVAGDIAKLGGAVASASALFKQFGSEGSDSQKAIQTALETTNTILGAGAIAEGVASAARLAGVAATKLATVAQSAYTAGVGTSTGALKAFKIVLASTGIGLAIIAFGKLAEATNLFGDDSKKNAEKAEKALKNYQRTLTVVFGSLDKGYRDEIKAAILAGQTEEQLNALKSKLLKERLALIQAEGAKLKLGETDKRAELVKLEVGYQAELDGIEIDAYKRRQDRREKNQELEKAAAQKRRETLKSEIDAIVQIVSEADKKIRLDVLRAEQTTILQGLNNVIKNTKTFAEVLAELRAEGQGPYADFIKNLFDSGKTILEISKIIEESFGKKTQDILNEFTTKGIDDLTASFDELVKDLAGYEEDVKKFGIGFGETFTTAYKLPKASKEDLQKTISGLFGIPSIPQLVKSLDDYRASIDKFFADERAKLNELKATNKITAAEFETAIQNLGKLYGETDDKFTQFKARTVKSFVDLSNEILTTNITKVQTAAQDAITKLEIKLYQDSANKTAKERAKLEENFQKQKKEIVKKEIEDEIKLLDKQEKDIQVLRDQGVISIEEAANKIEEIERKKNVLQKNLAKETTGAIVTQEQKRVEAAQEFLMVLQKVKEAYALISGSIQAIGNLLVDQAALQDLRYSEEIERVQELYDERFRLIDEEEEKLDALEQAKDNKISATERKRRALARERANLEAQQAEELAQLEADRANAAADAAIQQAEVNFALAVGQIIISTAEAIGKSIAISPQTFGLPFSAFAAAQGALQLAAANSARQVAIAQAEASRPGVSGAKNVRISKAEGGLITGPGNAVSDSVPANLSAGEFVVNANATRQFLPLLNQINQSGLQGGNAVNASGFSDPAAVALLQEIKTQLAQPNRSYVVYNDIENIQNKQNYINRRSNVL